ncbi:uncharacterized protein LOC131847261 [Achroia grisella]|uniref:uncharacterized protein LOC131847261 n=1 Tax=Achroia grisella TaxID=688607 RepID=UPI0027D2D573|nr:uncharacterized protein LOC131847261 [Achroia grisella]
MSLYAIGWTTEEDKKLAALVEPHNILYSVNDSYSSRKNILARENTWQEIGQELSKPVEECKRRWRGLRDGYVKGKDMGTMHNIKAEVFEKLQFLDETMSDAEETLNNTMEMVDDDQEKSDSPVGIEQQVITDNQEYYEITVVDGPQESTNVKQFIKILPKKDIKVDPLKKIKRKCGRKKSLPIPRNIPPIKILPKPILLNQPKPILLNQPAKVVQYVEDQKTPEQRSEVIDKLIERILKENTNEIDVFFRSMAASVRKLQPNLIPKVKMEVCNVIAKYEMQSFDKNTQKY